MLIEDASTKCPSCKNPLIWLNVKRVEGDAQQFSFGCNTCKREYVYVGARLIEKLESGNKRDIYAESTAIARSETEAALKHRCPACGGPISDGRVGPIFTCLWCGEGYAVGEGELVPKLEDHLLKPKGRLSDFYAIRTKR